MNYDLFLYLLKAGLVLAVLTVAYAWLVKRETFLQVNRWLLWINVAATLLLPIIPMPDFEWMPDAPAKAVAEVMPSRQALPDSKPSKKYEELAVAPLPINESTENQDTAPIASALTLWDWIGIVYGLVVVLLTLKLVIQLGTLWRLKRNGINYEPEDGVQLVESEKITAPFSFFHWVFYNPIHHNDDEWAQIWAHECIHVHQRHSIDMLMAEALKIVFWFNPFAWWHQRLVQETLEFITDRAVLDSGVEKKSYQYHLLRSTLSADKQTFPNSINAPHFNKSFLKERIKMMNKKKSKWLGVGKYGLFIGMIWLCAAFTKPYRAEVAAKIVEKVPELKEFAENKATIKATLKDVFYQETPLNKKTKITKPTLPPPVDKLVSQTKYVLFKEGYIEWILTPMIKRSDFVAIQKEFHKINYVFSVTHIEYDPLSHHLLDAGFRIDRNEKGKSLTHEHFYPKFKIPVTGIYGTIDIKTGYATIGGRLSKSPLYQVALDDQKTADDWVGENREKYLEFELNEHRNKNTVHSLNFNLDNLNYLSQTGVKNRVYFDKNRKLHFEEFPGRTEVIIDGKTDQLSNAEKFSFGDITNINFHNFYPPSDTIRHYSVIAIYTKKFKKLP